MPNPRYWVPDASVNLSEVANDFALIKQAGLGGMELLGYYLYGNYPSVVQEGGPVPVDWTKYGWASDAWSKSRLTSILGCVQQLMHLRGVDRGCFAGHERPQPHHGLRPRS